MLPREVLTILPGGGNLRASRRTQRSCKSACSSNTPRMITSRVMNTVELPPQPTMLPEKRPQQLSCGLYRLRSKYLLRRSLLTDVVQTGGWLRRQRRRRDEGRRIDEVKELGHVVGRGV